MQDIGQLMNLQKTLHPSPLQASYGVYFDSNSESYDWTIKMKQYVIIEISL